MALWLWLLGALLVGGAIVLTVDYLNKGTLINKIKEFLLSREFSIEDIKKMDIPIKEMIHNGDYIEVNVGLRVKTKNGDIIQEDSIQINAKEVSSDIRKGMLISEIF